MLVQLVYLKENGKVSYPASCTGCNKKCLKNMEEITVKGPGLPTLSITQENWWFCLDEWRKHTGDQTVPDCMILISYGICPASVISEFSYTMFALYNDYRPNRRYVSTKDYYSEPSIVSQGFSVINSEIGELHGDG